MCTIGDYSTMINPMDKSIVLKCVLLLLSRNILFFSATKVHPFASNKKKKSYETKFFHG